ncbi:DUF2971 domain-containing protein [Polaribacter sp. IC063]|uniref:DUF2971 domain-containing protein n=1 Tax=Polaribacter sp. IC063 TaxID=57031 RepID=UPI0011BFE4C6|nr:DUF2971 domain-containing protein [Polaribacter sp. IC063]TXD50716.1 DUF2971 domain-containing protein [Polaribacter sp. IC063]
MKIYKYCPVSKHSIDNLKNCMLMFSTPNNFNDKQDSNLPLTNVNSIEVKEKYRKEILNLSEEEKSKIKKLTPPKGFFEDLGVKNINDLFNNVSENLNSSINIEEKFNEYKSKYVGITCFSERFDNEKMWKNKDYGYNHKGFCLCFETDNDPVFFKDFEKINYEDELPKHNLLCSEKERKEELKKNFTTKLKDKFSYEEEYRLIVNNKPGLYEYNKFSLIEIYLGKDINLVDKKSIFSTLKKVYRDNVYVTQL